MKKQIDIAVIVSDPESELDSKEMLEQIAYTLHGYMKASTKNPSEWTVFIKKLDPPTDGPQIRIHQEENQTKDTTEED